MHVFSSHLQLFFNLNCLFSILDIFAFVSIRYLYFSKIWHTTTDLCRFWSHRRILFQIDLLVVWLLSLSDVKFQWPSSCYFQFKRLPLLNICCCFFLSLYLYIYIYRFFVIYLNVFRKHIKAYVLVTGFISFGLLFSIRLCVWCMSWNYFIDLDLSVITTTIIDKSIVCFLFTIAYWLFCQI